MPRNPTPTALKVIKGERKDRINIHEPIPADHTPVPPDWLAPGARARWDRLAPDLIAKGVLTFWDAELFAQWCQMMEVAARAQAELAAGALDGEMVQRGKVTSPLWRVAKEAVAEALRIASRFGLTPADRGRLSVGGKQDDGDNSRYLTT